MPLGLLGAGERGAPDGRGDRLSSGNPLNGRKSLYPEKDKPFYSGRRIPSPEDRGVRVRVSSPKNNNKEIKCYNL